MSFYVSPLSDAVSKDLIIEVTHTSEFTRLYNALYNLNCFYFLLGIAENDQKCVSAQSLTS
jgi:hypothetical protein